MKEITDIEELFKKYSDGNCTENEIKILQEYLKRDDLLINFEQMMNKYGLAIQLLDALKTPNESENKESKKSFEKIRSSIEAQDKRLHPYKKFSEFTLLKAASVLLVTGLLAWVLFLASHPVATETTLVTKKTERGQKANIILSDGSTVMLNSESMLMFPKEFGDIRDVSLVGEGYFVVNRNEQKPFVVRSGSLATTVLGTSFNIKAYPEDKEIEVAVASGKVAVTTDENKIVNQYLLTPNTLATYNTTDNEIKIDSRNIQDLIAWKEGVLKFSEVKFAQIVKTLEKWYGVTITLENEQIGNCIIIAEFKNESLKNVMKTMQHAMEIEYEFGAEGVIVSGKGCP